MPSSPALAITMAAWTIVAPAIVLPASTSSAAPKPSASVDAKQPLLSIGVDNGRTEVTVGDQLTYQTKIRNVGATDAKQLEISQSLPVGLRLVTAKDHGKATDGSVTWRIDLKAGQESTLTTVAEVTETPDELLRLATVACATAKGGEKPLVCATHSDLLPAGAAAARVAQPTTNRIWYGLAGGIAALVALGLVAAFRIRRRLQKRSALPSIPGTSAPTPNALAVD
ncbi:hypothetical protein [Micromonospora sp. NPDC092111]|uniref:hypothetical protein n=1 Tax=Micromonospora sp. NPDC092111 TaxID=3364289 RepID=UPI00382E939A